MDKKAFDNFLIQLTPEEEIRALAMCVRKRLRLWRILRGLYQFGGFK